MLHGLLKKQAPAHNLLHPPSHVHPHGFSKEVAVLQELAADLSCGLQPLQRTVSDP